MEHFWVLFVAIIIFFVLIEVVPHWLNQNNVPFEARGGLVKALALVCFITSVLATIMFNNSLYGFCLLVAGTAFFSSWRIMQ